MWHCVEYFMFKRFVNTDVKSLSIETEINRFCYCYCCFTKQFDLALLLFNTSHKDDIKA